MFKTIVSKSRAKTVDMNNSHAEFMLSCHKLMDEISSLSVGRSRESTDLRTASILASLLPVPVENTWMAVAAQKRRPLNVHLSTHGALQGLSTVTFHAPT